MKLKSGYFDFFYIETWPKYHWTSPLCM